MKITLKQFFEDFPKRQAVIHCRTEEQALILLKAFHKMGKCWCNGQSYLDKSYWEERRENIVYSNGGQYGNIQYSRNNHHTIFEFEDVILDEYIEKLKDFIRSKK